MAKITVCLVGCGMIGAGIDCRNKFVTKRTHLNAILENVDFELISVVETNSERRKLISQCYNSFGVYSTVQDALEKKFVDLLVFACEGEQAYSALSEVDVIPERVLIEKPLSKNYTAASNLITKLSGKKVWVCYPRRYMNNYEDVKKRFQAGEFGKLIGGSGTYNKGVLHNGCHIDDTMNFLFGDIVNEIELVKREENINKETFPVDLIYKFDRGQRVYFTNISHETYLSFDMNLYFDKVRIEFRNHGLTIRIIKPSNDGLSECEKVSLDSSEEEYLGGVYRGVAVGRSFSQEHSIGFIKLVESLD